MLKSTDDLRIRELRELSTPAEVIREYPRTEGATRAVTGARHALHNILAGRDDRLAVVIGPCSIHDRKPRSITPPASGKCASASPDRSKSSCASISKSPGPRSVGRA